MGFSKKSQIDGGIESEGRKWVIAGIPVRSALRPINTKPKAKDFESGNGDGDDSESCSTTPTEKESRIPERLRCPPAPRKRRPSSRCNFNGVREFFTPPDLETVFIRHVEKAN
ncbi:cyclin-dependent kinase inhibitor SMR3-like protein [Parasponia andersonii]|uniref:Cyclin-dependent kinase inhibitor SMR3-like protein n=1 Tax=Parasponia andersonii TaxID=3476 RepID=A0A2P5AYF1_PARAD|nr:cyclin-dependent kinase inhibitor SMR3-like protein [Parasponia andersonii]